MQVIEAYWKHVAKKLGKGHPEAKDPAEWTKSEAQSFLNKLQLKTDKSISTTTFRRIFKEGHLGTIGTKDIFAQYFDYPTHGDYIREELKKKKIPLLWLLLIPLGLGVGLLVKNWAYLTTMPQTSSDESNISAIIDKAVTEQFLAFKAIPNYNSNLENLKEVYSTQGSAYQQVLSILKRQSNLKWTLNNPSNASTAQLVKVVVDSIGAEQAYVTTIEHWRLDWFNQLSQRDEYKYETTNEQKYILVLDEVTKQWKILQNNYSGNKFRFIPKYISCDNISKQTTDIETVKKSVRTAVENDGLGLALRILDCYYQNNNNQKFPDALSLLLSEKTKLLRAINTDEIDKTAFEIKKSVLFEEVLEYLNQL